MATKKLDVEPLITHRFLIDKADKAYEMVFGNTERYLGCTTSSTPKSMSTRIAQHDYYCAPPREVKDDIGIGVIGAGNFARLTMLPAIQRSLLNVTLHSIASARGMTAQNLGKQFGFSISHNG